MTYPVNLLLNRPECVAVITDTDEDIARAEFRVTALTRSHTLQTNEATALVQQISSLTDQIDPLEARIATMPAGAARTGEELKLRALKRDREELEDRQIGDSGGRSAFRRSRELEAAQRQLAAYQECRAQVQARHDSLPA
ncbi:hypothetical protein [Hymenobacter sp. B81]|uniref:hypothetical protein n=1 Tax=Hymenobacter sp. B81 TaxID=3344878 RepID=UPI0037DC422C